MTTTQERPVQAMPPKSIHPGRRGAARRKELAALMERRPDLHGVYKPADVAAESALWSA